MKQQTFSDIEYSQQRNFMHIDFLTEQVPDAAALLHFRHLIEGNKIGERIFSDVRERLDRGAYHAWRFHC